MRPIPGGVTVPAGCRSSYRGHAHDTKTIIRPHKVFPPIVFSWIVQRHFFSRDRIHRHQPVSLPAVAMEARQGKIVKISRPAL